MFGYSFLNGGVCFSASVQSINGKGQRSTRIHKLARCAKQIFLLRLLLRNTRLLIWNHLRHFELPSQRILQKRTLPRSSPEPFLEPRHRFMASGAAHNTCYIAHLPQFHRRGQTIKNEERDKQGQNNKTSVRDVQLSQIEIITISEAIQHAYHND